MAELTQEEQAIMGDYPGLDTSSADGLASLRLAAKLRERQAALKRLKTPGAGYTPLTPEEEAAVPQDVQQLDRNNKMRQQLRQAQAIRNGVQRDALQGTDPATLGNSPTAAMNTFNGRTSRTIAPTATAPGMVSGQASLGSPQLRIPLSPEPVVDPMQRQPGMANDPSMYKQPGGTSGPMNMSAGTGVQTGAGGVTPAMERILKEAQMKKFGREEGGASPIVQGPGESRDARYARQDIQDAAKEFSKAKSRETQVNMAKFKEERTAARNIAENAASIEVAGMGAEAQAAKGKAAAMLDPMARFGMLRNTIMNSQMTEAERDKRLAAVDKMEADHVTASQLNTKTKDRHGRPRYTPPAPAPIVLKTPPPRPKPLPEFSLPTYPGSTPTPFGMRVPGLP